jgi:hypothetical protein
MLLIAIQETPDVQGFFGDLELNEWCAWEDSNPRPAD